MYGAHPRLFPLGTKTGCRRLFAEEDVRHPLGVEGLFDEQQVVDAVVGMRRQRPVPEVIVKLDEGVSGEGNALVDLRDLPASGAVDEADAVRDRLRAMQPEQQDATYDEFMALLGKRGGIVEERIVGEELRSPSVQLRVLPTGEVEQLSTHDQLLGGLSGQSYLGCVFPADPAYAAAISRLAGVVGQRLADEGVLGRFAVDFVVVRDEAGGWTPYAIEINLRKGGTTHPFLTLQFLTDGTYDPEEALFRTPTGDVKHLVATDHLERPELRGLLLDDLFDIVARHRLQFDQSRQEGVVFHMLSSLTELGRIGLTAVGNTPERAQEIYRQAEDVLLAEARDALRDIEVTLLYADLPAVRAPEAIVTPEDPAQPHAHLPPVRAPERPSRRKIAEPAATRPGRTLHRPLTCGDAGPGEKVSVGSRMLLPASHRRRTVPNIWWLHWCKSPTGCVTGSGDLPTGQAGPSPADPQVRPQRRRGRRHRRCTARTASTPTPGSSTAAWPTTADRSGAAGHARPATGVSPRWSRSSSRW